VGSVLIAEDPSISSPLAWVVRERGVHLGQGEVPEVLADLLRAETQLVPTGDPLNRDTRASHHGTPSSEAAPTLDQAADIGDRGHGTIIAFLTLVVTVLRAE
jgi:hypothetical protein